MLQFLKYDTIVDISNIILDGFNISGNSSCKIIYELIIVLNVALNCE